MAKYQETTVTVGAWAKASDIKSGTKAKLISEVKPQPSSFQDKNGNAKTQDVAKVKFEGMPEAVNVSLNKATINGLVRAFGDDSVNWMNKILTAETEKMRVSGKAVVALYLIPEGFDRIDDENGYAVIVKDGQSVKTPDQQLDELAKEEEINPEDIPF